MKGLVERDKMLDLVCEACNKEFYNEGCEPGECRIREAILGAPAIHLCDMLTTWISVADMLPKESDFVLVADARTNEFAFACLRKDESGEMRWFGSSPDEDLNISWGFEEFTHWIEVPDAPEEEST